MDTREELPPQTAHKTWASYLAGLAVSLITAASARWGLELSADATVALLIVLTPIASAAATYLKRNWQIDTGAGFCHPLAVLAALGLALVLAGCETAAKALPRTAAGWEQGGITGALDGAAGGVAVICRRLDGAEVRVLVDTSAALAGQQATVERMRAMRQQACEVAGLLDSALAPAGAPLPLPRPAGED